MPAVLNWIYDYDAEEWVPAKSDAYGVQQVYDPKVGSLISFRGTTTSDGAGDGSTLVCSDLTSEADFNGNLVIITSGSYEGQARDINGVTTGGTVTPGSAFGGQIVSGITFVIAAIRTVPVEVAAIEAKLDHASHGLAALKAILDTSGVLVNARTTAYTRLVGVLQIKATTIELNQAAGAKDLFTGTSQDVVIEKLVIRIPVDVSGGAMTSLSIQTDDTTAQVIIDSTTGAKANLTAQAQLSWTGAILLKATKKIQLTIAGAATGIACDCDVVCECRAVVAGGYLG